MSQSTSRSATSSPSTPPGLEVRPLRAEDLEAVIALDHRSMGASRRGYFEKRLAAAQRKPKGHLQLGVMSSQGLVGFLLSRMGGGEYGRPDEVVVIEAVGVDPSTRQAGLGRRMLAELAGLASARGIHRLVTQVEWHNHLMLRFLAGTGFEIAPWPVLERALDRIPLPATDEEIEILPPVVRNLRAGDFDAIRRIDRAITGQDRTRYLERKFDEALQESAIAVSLVGEADGLPAAFAMARVDFGDFGHVEATAALDTIGVDPLRARQGLGKAVLHQMIENLAALHVEHLETEVPRDNFTLLQFLDSLGFGASQRLSFQKKI